MLEIPEAQVLAAQITQLLAGKTITGAAADTSPHKFAWYHNDPQGYHQLLRGKIIQKALAHAGQVEILADNTRLLFADGVSLRYIPPGKARPAKHQLLLELSDDSALVATIQMYGGLWAFKEGDFQNSYHDVAKAKPSPLSPAFTKEYYDSITAAASSKLSAKAFLATEQRIPGLGNGVLQDILFKAKVHPKRKLGTLSHQEHQAIYTAITGTLKEMTAKGGRVTEKDLLGNPGGYQTILSKMTVGLPCPECGQEVKKEAYMGGSIYYCPGCQEL